MINLFVPVAPLEALGPVRGLTFGPSGEVQKDFAARFAGRGTILVGFGPQGCLCGFADWEALREVARDAITRHGVDEIAAMRFWSGDRHPLRERKIDLDQGPLEAPEIGEIVHLCMLPPEQRRHRDLVAALQSHVGGPVTLRTRGGRVIRGTLEAFDTESDCGTIDGEPFTTWELTAVHG
jgi:hypothetical protein